MRRKIGFSRVMPSCKFFNRHGVCHRPNCKYDHSRIKICKYFESGECTSGSHCRYRHIVDSDAGSRQQHAAVSAPDQRVPVAAGAPAGKCVVCWTEDATCGFLHINQEEDSLGQLHWAACEGCAGDIHLDTRKCPTCNQFYDILSTVFDHRRFENPRLEA